MVDQINVYIISYVYRSVSDSQLFLANLLLLIGQVLGTMIIYALFMYDGIRGSSWKHLDDSIYYSKAVTHTLEFIVALFVLAYGAKESLLGLVGIMMDYGVFLYIYRVTESLLGLV